MDFLGIDLNKDNRSAFTDIEPTITYSNNVVSRIDYSNGDYKTFTYSSGLLTTIAYVRSDEGVTITKNLIYNGNNNLTSINEVVS